MISSRIFGPRILLMWHWTRPRFLADIREALGSRCFILLRQLQIGRAIDAYLRWVYGRGRQHSLDSAAPVERRDGLRDSRKSGIHEPGRLGQGPSGEMDSPGRRAA